MQLNFFYQIQLSVQIPDRPDQGRWVHRHHLSTMQVPFCAQLEYIGLCRFILYVNSFVQSPIARKEEY